MQLDPSQRFVSRLTHETFAMILAGGRGTRLQELTTWRAKPAVPFGGQFRIVDFALSNCFNSGIRRIGVLTQYKAHSLIRHVQRGWGSLRGEFGEFVEILPAQQRLGPNWYRGTADAIYQNIDILRSHKARFVLVLAGDHVYRMDYGPMIGRHLEIDADLTIGAVGVPLEQASAFGVMSIDSAGRVRGFDEKPASPTPLPNRADRALASMGIYVFSTDFLVDRLIRDADDPSSSHDFGKDIIPSVIENHKVYAYPFQDVNGEASYWRDVGTVDAYWQANLELTNVTPELDLYDRGWPIWTNYEQLPPAKFVFDDDGRRGMAVDSLVSGGCIVSGALLRRTLLFTNVIVRDGTEIVDSVILPEVEIGRDCRIQRAIIDRGCIIEDGMQIGTAESTDEHSRYHVTPSGVTLVTPEMLGQKLHYVG